MREPAPLPGRYTRTPLPPYRFTPGRHPHPVRDPRGYAHGQAEVVETIDADEWATCGAYLYGVDLFNHGYYWAAHEAWESAWRGAAADGDVRTRLRGLIQSAAALLKCEAGEIRGAGRLASRGADALRAGPAALLGLDGAALADRIEAAASGDPAERPRIELEGVAPLS